MLLSLIWTQVICFFLYDLCCIYIRAHFSFISGNGIPGDWPGIAAGGAINCGRCGLGAVSSMPPGLRMPIRSKM